MKIFEKFLAEIENPEHRTRTEEVLTWVTETFPQLTPEIKWNQPMLPLMAPLLSASAPPDITWPRHLKGKASSTSQRTLQQPAIHTARFSA